MKDLIILLLLACCLSGCEIGPWRCGVVMRTSGNWAGQKTTVRMLDDHSIYVLPQAYGAVGDTISIRFDEYGQVQQTARHGCHTEE